MDSAGVAISGVAAEKTWLDPDNLNLRGKQKDDLSQLILLLKSRQGQSKAVADCLLGKSSSVSQPVESMRRLVAEVDALAPKQSRETTLAILGRVVGRWNTVHSPQLPLPEFPVRMPKPVPPFTSGRWAGLTRYRAWADAVLNDIVQSAPAEVNDPSTKTNEAVPEGIENCVARVLASAVLWGGILCHKYLGELYSSLSRWPEISECASNRVYVVWFDRAMNCRRWMPDAITTLAMMRLKLEQLPEVAAFTAKHRMEHVLLKYFRTLLPDNDLCPNTITEFIDSSLLHFELRLPRCLTEYAAGRLPSISPAPATWARMVHHKPLLPKTTKITGTVIEEQNRGGDEQPESPDERDDWLAELRQLLGSGDSQLTPSQAQKAIKVRLRGYKGGQLEHVFLRFSEDILLDHQRGRLKTVRDLVTALAKKLPAAVDLKQPGAIPPDTLVSAYSFLLDDAETPSQHKKLRGYLRSWHRWLVRTELSQPIDETDVFGNARQAQIIDARLIMEDEYLKARDSLVDWKMTFDQEADLEKDIRQIAGLILILGYRTGLVSLLPRLWA